MCSVLCVSVCVRLCACSCRNARSQTSEAAKMNGSAFPGRSGQQEYNNNGIKANMQKNNEKTKQKSKADSNEFV